MAAAIGSHGVAYYRGDDVPKPSAIVMAYRAHSDYSAAEPPTFVVVGEREGIAPPAIMERTVEVLRRSGTKGRQDPRIVVGVTVRISGHSRGRTTTSP